MFVWSYRICCWNSCPIPPSNSDGDLSLAIWHLWEIPWILTWLPQMVDNDHVMPLDWKCFCSLGIHRANFPAIFKQTYTISKQFPNKLSNIETFFKRETPLYIFKQESLQRLPKQRPLFKIFSKPHTKHHFKQLKSKSKWSKTSN